MIACSVLFADPSAEPQSWPDTAPGYFEDLHLDQVVRSMTASRAEYGIEPFYWLPLDTVDAIAYRHEVFRDLEHEDVLAAIRSFAEGMRGMRTQLAQMGKLHYAEQRQRWFLDAVETYCEVVCRFAGELVELELESRALLRFREFLAAHVAHEHFDALRNETAELKRRLAEIRYTVHIKANKVTVRRFEDEADYSREVADTFERFRQAAVKDYRVAFTSSADMNQVEAQVLRCVTQLHPVIFGEVQAHCERHAGYLDETVARFDRDIQFYVATLEHVQRFERAGLRCCLPGVSDASKAVAAQQTFDLALAEGLIGDGTRVVCNDFALDDPERIIVISGPNQGGKTTFARTFGQLHHLAAIGCPVPGVAAQLFLFDELYTHFEKEEDIGDLSGKLGTDLARIHGILEAATPQSIIIMNESFSATTLQDASFLGTKILERIIDLDALCVCVTFVDELASLSDTTVSMMSTVVEGDPAQRTFRIERRPADGLAYAGVLARKYRLTYAELSERIAS